MPVYRKSGRLHPAHGDGDRVLRFSFRYLDTAHPTFNVRGRDAVYFHRLLARLRELSGIRLAEFLSTRSSSMRVHRINFQKDRVAVKSFGLHEELRADEQAWQFSLSANEHGRVHGFLMEDTFFVRWLDPEHNLYPGG